MHAQGHGQILGNRAPRVERRAGILEDDLDRPPVGPQRGGRDGRQVDPLEQQPTAVGLHQAQHRLHGGQRKGLTAFFLGSVVPLGFAVYLANVYVIPRLVSRHDEVQELGVALAILSGEGVDALVMPGSSPLPRPGVGPWAPMREALTTTLAPSAANRRAIARPIPRDPPVTNATSRTAWGGAARAVHRR